MDSYLRENVFCTLSYALLLMLLLWWLKFLWQRRRLYYFASKRGGPLSLPFIGNGLYFIGPTTAFLYKILTLTKLYESPVRFWLGQELYFAIFEPKDVETILNSTSALNKSKVYKFWKPLSGTSLFSASESKWKRHRKLIMPMFNQKILNGFVPIFVEQSNILSERLENEIGKGSFNVFRYMSRCGLDIICETSMGTTVQAQIRKLYYFEWINKVMEVIYTRMYNVLYHFDFIFNLTDIAKEFDGAVKKIHNFTESVIQQKRETYNKKRKESKTFDQDSFNVSLSETVKSKCFLEHLIELSENEGIKFTDEELREEVNTFTLAGTDSTSSVMSFVLMMLGMYQDIQEKVFQEVLDVLGQEKQVEYTDLNKLKYLERVTLETMRIFPALPIILRSVTKDIELEKCVVPSGSAIAILIISLHRDPDVWPEPLKFDPDRFLPEEIEKRPLYSYLPFAGGPRNCIGVKYAPMEMKAVLATLVRKYKFSSNYRAIEDIKLKVGVLLKPVDGHNVSIELRNKAQF